MTEQVKQLRKQIKLLFFFAGLSLVLLFAALLKIFLRNDNSSQVSFDEITAKRINIIEPNGQYRMILSNTERSPGVLAYGKPFGIPGGNRPGIIFFNDEGTECGGLVFSGRRDSLNGKYFASGHFSFDQYNQNQVLYFQYLDDNGERKTGLYVDDWQESPAFPEWRAKYKDAQKLPDGKEKDARLKQLMEPTKGNPAFAHRVFIGKDSDKSAVINLSDKTGKIRMQIIVDSLGSGRINFLDSTGRIVNSLPNN